MLLIGKDGVHFLHADLTCVLNDVFNVILFTDCTAVYGAETHEVGFIVPVKYLSFIKTLNSKFNLGTPLDRIFRFQSPQDMHKLQKYVSELRDDGTYERLYDLLPRRFSKVN